LQIVDISTPSPQKGQILIKVAAAGINRADLFQVQGKYPYPSETNGVPGLEVSGEVVEIGEGVSRFKLGDKVCALLVGGGYAEYALAEADLTLTRPENLDFLSAAALPEALATVWLTLFMRGGLKSGEYLFIHGGTSGIGTTAIQIAQIFGAQVIASASNAEKCAFIESLGAQAVNYTQDFAARVKEITNGQGVNLLLDITGGDLVEANLKCLSYDGRMVSIAFMRGAQTSANLAGLLMKNISWQGVTLRSRPVAEKAQIMQQVQEKIWPIIATEQFKPIIYKSFSLENAEKAHISLQENLHIGKTMLIMGT